MQKMLYLKKKKTGKFAATLGSPPPNSC